MLLKAKPMIDAVEKIINKLPIKTSKFQIIFPSPSKEIFTQKTSHKLSKIQNLIFVC
jgi:tRNA G37 N-methylase TrmD